MSASPTRVPSIGAARRVSFSPLPGELKAGERATAAMSKVVDLPPSAPPQNAAQRVADSPARPGSVHRATAGAGMTATRRTDTPVDDDDAQPATASHRTRSSDHSCPSRDSLVAAYQRKRAESPPGQHRGPTTAVEFSLQDTPLLSTMAPPVWREPSPSTHPLGRHSASARLSTPGRRTTTTAAHHSSEEPTAQDSMSTSRASAVSSNPFTDVEREMTNQKRRHIVVRHFFASHEDAVRLYIRLEQLLQLRDLCETEFRERLAALPTEEARAAVLASRGARGAAAGGADREIQKLQAALAQAAAASPELSSTLSSLCGFTPPPPSSLPVVQGEEAVAKPKSRATVMLERLAADRAARASTSTASPDKSAPSLPLDPAGGAPAEVVERTPWRGTPKRSASPRTRPGASPADSARTPGTSPTSRQRRPSQPSAALEAWRNANKDGDGKHKSGVTAAPSPSGKAAATTRRGRTPPSRSTSDDDPHPTSAPAHRVKALPSTSPARPPMSPPRKTAAAPVPPAAATAVSPLRVASLSDSGARRSSSRGGGGGRVSSPWLQRAAPAMTSATSSPPPRVPVAVSASPASPTKREPAATAPAAAAAATPAARASPPRGTAPLKVAALVHSPGRRTPPAPAAGTPPQRLQRRGSSASASLTDSPLARYRAQRGYQDPIQHFHTHMPLVTPHDSLSSLSPRWGAHASDEAAPHSPPPPPAAAADAAHATTQSSPTAAVMRMATPARYRPAVAGGDASGRTMTSPSRLPPLPGSRAAAPAPRPAPPHKLSLERSPTSSCHVQSSPGQSGASEVPTTSHLPDPRAAVISAHVQDDAAPPSEPVGTAPPRSPLLGPSTDISADAATSGAAAAPSAAMRQHPVTRHPASSAIAVAGLAPQRLHIASSASLPQVHVLPSESLPSEDMSGWSPAEPALGAPESSAPPVVFQRHPLGDPAARVSASRTTAHAVASQESHRAPLVAAEATVAASRMGEAPSRGDAAVGSRPFAEAPSNGAGSSVWDEIVALERRVSGLESRTSALEKNAAKRAVLEAIRVLKVRVGTLEERTSALELQESNPPLHLNW